MRVAGYKKEIDYERLGDLFILASSVILAIRTARNETLKDVSLSQRDWETEIEHSLKVARMLVSHATAKYGAYFRHRDVPWYEPDDEDVLK